MKETIHWQVYNRKKHKNQEQKEADLASQISELDPQLKVKVPDLYWVSEDSWPMPNCYSRPRRGTELLQVPLAAIYKEEGDYGELYGSDHECRRIYKKNLRQYAGQWIDQGECFDCKSTSSAILYYCAWHRCVTCTECCHANAQIECVNFDTTYSLTDNPEDEERLNADEIAAWQVPSALRAIIDQNPDGIKCEGHAGTACTSPFDNFCASCSLFFCQDKSEYHENCKTVTFSDLSEAWISICAHLHADDAALISIFVANGLEQNFRSPSKKKTSALKIADLLEHNDTIQDLFRHLEWNYALKHVIDLREAFLLHQTFEIAKDVSSRQKRANEFMRYIEVYPIRRNATEWNQKKIEIAKFLESKGNVEDSEDKQEEQVGDEEHEVKHDNDEEVDTQATTQEQANLRQELFGNESEEEPDASMKEKASAVQQQEHIKEMLEKTKAAYDKKTQLEREARLKKVRDFTYKQMRWQDYQPNAGEKFQFIFWDPYYELADQPAGSEWLLARDLIDKVTEPGSVVWIFGKLQHLWTCWVPNMLKKSKVDKSIRWHLDPNNHYTIRSESRTCGPQSPLASKNIVDVAIIFVRMDGGRLPENWIKFDQVADMFPGSVHGDPHHNVFKEYRPPTFNERLKDEDGKVLRPRAERTVEWCEHILLRYTSACTSAAKGAKGRHGLGRVLDMQAGTGVLGAACLKHDRGYFGMDMDPRVVQAGTNRLSRFYALLQSGIIHKNMEGVRRVTMKQIVGLIPVLPSNNRPNPTDTYHIPQISTDPACNFGDFRDQKPGRDYPPLDFSHEIANGLFDVKETGVRGVQSLPVGKGVFSAGAWQPGDVMPIYFWGDIMDIATYNQKYGNKKKMDHPMKGALCLQKPFIGYIIELSDACPGRFINDFTNLATEPNVVVAQATDDLDEIINGYPHFGLQMLLRLICKSPIAPGDQILMSYGRGFWSKSELAGTPIEQGVLNIYQSQEQEAEEESEDEEKEVEVDEPAQPAQPASSQRKRKRKIVEEEEEPQILHDDDEDTPIFSQLDKLTEGRTKITPSQTKTKSPSSEKKKEAAKATTEKKLKRKVKALERSLASEMKKAAKSAKKKAASPKTAKAQKTSTKKGQRKDESPSSTDTEKESSSSTEEEEEEEDQPGGEAEKAEE
jgi:hypothetical protein